MLTMLATIGRVIAGHWPALLALHLAGSLVRYGAIELAGWVGATSAIGGLLLLPLAVLARLAAFVGMFLVVRDGMRQLTALVPPPVEPHERRRAFLGAMLAGILPFFATYWAMGDLREDWAAYSARALEVQSVLSLEAALDERSFSTDGTLADVALSAASIALIVIAFVGRWAWKRWSARLPRWLALFAVYLEAVWVFLSVTILAELVDGARAWVDDRQAVAWVADAREWLAAHLEPASWAWAGVDWLLGQAGAILGPPLAWLTIAGVLYGQAVAAQAPQLPERVSRLATARSRRIPAWARAQARQLGELATGRVQPIWRSLVLMWRAGPVLIGSVALLYAVVEALGTSLTWGVTRVVGPQSISDFWMVWDAVLLLPVAVVVETLRVAVVASAYDTTIGRLRERESARARATTPVDPDGADAAADLAARDEIAGGQHRRSPAARDAGSGLGEQQPRQVGAVDEQLELDGERPVGIGRHGEGRLDP